MKKELRNAQVLLRQYRPRDISALHTAALESVGEVYRWLPWCHPNYCLHEAEQWVLSRDAAWQQGQEYSFAMIDLQTDQFAGGCALNQIDPLRMRANLGYWVRTSCTARGLATAATRLLADFGFTDLKLQRIEIVAALDNLASQRVAQKAGAVREGIARARLRIHDQPYDAVCYSIIPSDLK